MIHIVESKSYKSDGDRSLRSYYGRLKERIKNADINITELTLGINETLQYIGSINEMLEEFRTELVGDVEEIKPFLPEKKKDELSETLDKIKEALDENDIKDITKEIEDASACLTHCQSCFSGSFARCEIMDSCVFAQTLNPCTECVSEQTGCSFCNTGQAVTCPTTYNPCVASDAICGEDYTSACSSCYHSLFNTCAQNELSCDHTPGCTGCQRNVQSCTTCQGNVGSCNNCYGGSVGTCGASQMNECGKSHASCTGNQEVRCRSNNDCTSGNDSCTSSVGCLLFNNIVCPTNYRKGPPAYCEMGYKGNGESCGSGYNGSVCSGLEGSICTSNFKDYITDCQSSYGECGTNNGMSCAGTYQIPGMNCTGQYSYSVNGDGEEHCTGGYTSSSGKSCPNDYIVDGDGNVGCRGGYPDCAECYGTSYGCSGCYDVDYCSKCNTAQTTCNTCVRGETTCDACVKGEEGHSTDVCSNCYGGCQSFWDRQKDCFTGSYGAAPPCTICNIGCQMCNTSCHSGDGCNDCGSSQGSFCYEGCGTSNCGSANCGQCESGESGCGNCDTVSPCTCNHTSSYDCGKSNCGGQACGLTFGICQFIQ